MSIRIVLVGTTHPGNIGACARAMKNMGIQDLALVAPLHFPHEDATARASGAGDILDNATVVATLEEAIEDCVLRRRCERSVAFDQLAVHGCQSLRGQID